MQVWPGGCSHNRSWQAESSASVTRAAFPSRNRVEIVLLTTTAPAIRPCAVTVNISPGELRGNKMKPTGKLGFLKSTGADAFPPDAGSAWIVTSSSAAMSLLTAMATEVWSRTVLVHPATSDAASTSATARTVTAAGTSVPSPSGKRTRSGFRR